MNRFVFDARDRRDKRMRARREEQLIVVFRVRRPLFRAHRDFMTLRGDRRHFAFRPHIECEHRAQFFRRLHEQRSLFFDDAAGIIRQAAIRERHVTAALDEHDVRCFIQPTQTRCCRCSAGHAADDDVLLFHFSMTPFISTSSPRDFRRQMICVSVPIGQ